MKISKILSGIAAGALAISTLASISSFSTFAAEDVIWEGEGDALSNWTNEFTIEGVSVENAEEGGTLTVSGTVNGTTPQIQFVARNGDDWTWNQFASYTDVSAANGKASFVLTAEQAGWLSTDCRAFSLKGQNFTPTKITYTAPGSLAGTTETLYSGETDLNDWSTILNVSALPTAAEGGVLTISITGAEAQAQVNLLDSAWNWNPIMDGENDFLQASDGKIKVTLTAEQAEMFSTGNGIAIKGAGIITEITYTHPGGTTEDESSGTDPIDDSFADSTDEPTDESIADTTDESNSDSATEDENSITSVDTSSSSADTSSSKASTSTSSTSNDKSPNTGVAAVAIAGLALAGAAIVVTKRK